MTHKNNKIVPKIALYQPDIPQNTAAIIRICSCLGANLEIIEPCGFRFNDKRFKRVVMDYLDIKKIDFYESYRKFLNAKQDNRIILCTTKARKNYNEFRFGLGDTLLFGRESMGVPENVHTDLNLKIKIPMVKEKRSLNLASSVAIILSEAIRQNNFKNYE